MEPEKDNDLPMSQLAPDGTEIILLPDAVTSLGLQGNGYLDPGHKNQKL